MKILFVNACVRKESRTKRLAEQVIERIKTDGDVVEEIYVPDAVEPITNEDFITSRSNASATHSFSEEVYAPARQFAEADVIVVGAPYWDLSFPAMLKQYFEQVNVVGITFRYTEEGIPVGLCKADRIFYVSTAGGTYAPSEFGFGYVKALAQGYYGIGDVRLIEAVGLDIYGNDVDAIMEAAEETIEGMDLE